MKYLNKSFSVPQYLRKQDICLVCGKEVKTGITTKEGLVHLECKKPEPPSYKGTFHKTFTNTGHF